MREWRVLTDGSNSFAIGHDMYGDVTMQFNRLSADRYTSTRRLGEGEPPNESGES